MTSHEFRAPLAAILSAQDLLKTFGQKLPSAQKVEVLDMIESGVHCMTRMLERVLFLGKVEAHMREFNPQKLNLHTLCRQLIDEAQNQHVESVCKLSPNFTATFAAGLYDEKSIAPYLR